MPSVLEQELVIASAFEPRRDYERQDYLAALARAVYEIPEAVFDGLSVEAQDWFNDAAKALNKKLELPEFSDVVEDEPDDEEADDEEPDEPDEPADEDVKEPLAEAPTEDEPDDEPADEPDEAPAKSDKKAAKPSKKAPKKAAAEPTAPPPPRRPKGQPARKLEHPPLKPLPPDADLDTMEFALDDFGIVVGTKNAAAAAMVRQGCRMADVTETIGGTYYNLLQRLVKQGHHLEKTSNGVLTLTHKDNVDKTIQPPAKAKKK